MQFALADMEMLLIICYIFVFLKIFVRIIWDPIGGQEETWL